MQLSPSPVFTTMFASTKSSTLSSPLFSLRRTSSISKPNLFNLVPMKASPLRNLSVSCSFQSQNGSPQKSSIQGGEAFFRGVLENMQSVYLNRNPTAKAILDLVHSADNNSICYDHLAFRTFGVLNSLALFNFLLDRVSDCSPHHHPTFVCYSATQRHRQLQFKTLLRHIIFFLDSIVLGLDYPVYCVLCIELQVNGHGIDSMASFFLDYGYTQRDELRFPAKKLRALWFAPPSDSLAGSGSGMNGPLPRIFISELLVDQMSPQTQEIIRKYTESSGIGNKHAALASSLGLLTWEKPLYSEFQQLASESEYAAWALVNGYAVNHVTISTHRLKTHLRDIKTLNQFIEESGFRLNSEGGVLKVSPDGLLLQSSTVADSVSFQFSDGLTKSVPCSYIEFAERLVLPQHKNLPDTEVKEFHRRDGFEVASADKIFESTSKEQVSRVGS